MPDEIKLQNHMTILELYRLGHVASWGCVQCGWGYEPRCVTCDARLKDAVRGLRAAGVIGSYGCDGVMP